MSERLFRPGMRLGSYPQKQDSGLSEFEQTAARWLENLRRKFERQRLNLQHVVSLIDRHDDFLKQCTDEALNITILQLREKLTHQGLIEELIAESFAVIRETAHRTLGKRHFDVQLYSGWIMMHGMVAEMSTGEGKTLTMTLPACTAALAGIPVHVITANDYLAGRDAEIMQPLYRRLGLTAGAVIDGMERDQRLKAYRNPIVHTTNKQITFDYLRDRLEIGTDTGPLRFQFRHFQNSLEHKQGGQLLLKGLCFALVDEADSVLIDEANTPLIITQTRPGAETPATYSDALYLASSLLIDEDYVVDFKHRNIELTQKGEDKLSSSINALPKLWQNKRKREILVQKALVARTFYIKGKQYLVKDDKVQIIDEFTGRVMADRSWEQGLHQLIEAKEGCIITEQRETLARISYQVFFSRYLHLAGTSGTLKEVASELHSVYGLHTVKVPMNRPSRLLMMPERIYKNAAIKRQALLARLADLHALGRPILIGTGSVAESEEVSSWLEKAGYPHQVLNAKQDKQEAEIIAKAGQQNAIMVATNMAGRGTDISLGLGVAELGGLHVIALNSNESRRIDRQLYGRAGRQGDPGSAEAILSLEDPALKHFYASALLRLFSLFCRETNSFPAFLTRLALRIPQAIKERRQRRLRKQVALHDKQLARLLAFSGKFE